MLVDTAIGAALKKAGRDTDADELFVAATEVLKRHVGKADQGAMREFCDTVLADIGPLGRALIGVEEIRRRAKAYLEARAKDMKGSSSGGRIAQASHGRDVVAPTRRPVGDEAGHFTHAASGGQNTVAPSSPPEPEAAGGQKGPASQEAIFPVPAAASGPTPAQRSAAAEYRAKTAKALMETTFVRGRGMWANIALGELRAIAVEDTRNALIARRLLNYVTPGMSMTATVRDVFSVSVFDQAFAEGDDAAKGVLADVA